MWCICFGSLSVGVLRRLHPWPLLCALSSLKTELQDLQYLTERKMARLIFKSPSISILAATHILMAFANYFQVSLLFSLQNYQFVITLWGWTTCLSIPLFAEAIFYNINICCRLSQFTINGIIDMACPTKQPADIGQARSRQDPKPQ